MRKVESRSRRVIIAILAIMAALAGGAVAGVPASAAVGRNQIREVAFTLAAEHGELGRITYSTFLASLRLAVSVESTAMQGLQTQTADEGLVRVRLRLTDGTEASLWINPFNLYVVGFSNRDGQTWQFNDMGGVLLTRRIQSGDPGGAGTQTLGFGGNYPSLNGVAGQGRADMPIELNNVEGSIRNLANAQVPNDANRRQAIARSLMLLINFTSEAVRLNDVEGSFRASMTENHGSTRRLPLQQQELENQWSRISNWMVTEYQNPRANLSLPNIPLIETIGDARRYVRVSQFQGTR